MNLALLIIDMQKVFFNGNSKESMEKASEYDIITIKVLEKMVKDK